MKNKKKIALFIAIAILGFFVYQYYLKNSSKEVKYVTSPVEKGNIVSSIRATGTLTPTKQIEIHYETAGVVKRTFGEVNDIVKKGDILALIESSGSEARLSQAKAKLNKARSDLDVNKDTYDINKNLYEKRLISKEEFDNSLSAYRASVAGVEEAKAELEQAKSNLEKTKITSSLDGIILEKNIIEGQKLYPDNSKPVYTIAEDLGTLTLVSNIGEADIGRISEGKKVYFTVDAYPEKNFSGSVSKILNSPKTENNVVTYDVLSKVDNGEMLLKPGMTAEVEIIISEKENILKIPTAALRFIPPDEKVTGEPKNSSTVVWSVSGEKLESHQVKTGISDDIYTEIEGENIKEGKELLIEYYYTNNENAATGITLPQPKRF